MFKKAFLFNGIGAIPENLFSKMPKFLLEKYREYQNDAFKALNLDTVVENNLSFDVMLSKWIISSICDRVIFEYYIENNIIPDIGAGYSLGLINICSCFSVFPYDVADQIIMKNKTTLSLLEKAKMDTDLGVIIGLDYKTVLEIIRNQNKEETVSIGSVNSKICVLITGMRESVVSVLESAIAEGALKAGAMNVHIAYHCSHIAPFCTEYKEFCTQHVFNDPRFPIISAFNQKILTKGDELIHENQINVTSPLRWDLTINKLEDLGVTDFFDMSADSAVKKISRCKNRTSKIHTFLEI